MLETYAKVYIEHERVELDELTEPGVYVISYWNGGSVFEFEGIHTVAVEYDGEKYTTYNFSGDTNANPQDYASGYICGYYLGKR